MSEKIDQTDRRILRALQIDSSRSQRELAEDVGLSQNALWRRLKNLESQGVIHGYGARVDPVAVGMGLVTFSMIRTRHHSADWLKALRQVLIATPEVVGFYRISGDYDYMLKIATEDIAAFDRVYQHITARIELDTVTSYFAMESIIDDRPLPL
ncbi:transcriptional regulator, AsnC family [Pseudooceanicola antarcticus]|uniref:Lrp/AsnC family transcriptional regulator n=1 Tax=Pseudooceanicola antarcticus TaxID=1247613 RepID=A0A285JIK5_9RHOB|nr:Lrp/AsnC family transcriptional regulator [Pseudooceanicola antarcticus]PJE26362.1 Lrp/AsnC family transcriptional regulator [Pseudooceanicola antarcticus]SNY59206.1 transcriptional regulator, AsnC family [Pseudooceanicola antarcticus]